MTKQILLLTLIMTFCAQAKELLHEISVEIPGNRKAKKIVTIKALDKINYKRNLQIYRAKNGKLMMSAHFKGEGGCVTEAVKGNVCNLPVNNLAVEYRGVVED